MFRYLLKNKNKKYLKVNKNDSVGNFKDTLCYSLKILIKIIKRSLYLLFFKGAKAGKWLN